jgi:hypothetical protein
MSDFVSFGVCGSFDAVVCVPATWRQNLTNSLKIVAKNRLARFALTSEGARLSGLFAWRSCTAWNSNSRNCVDLPSLNQTGCRLLDNLMPKQMRKSK